MSAINSIKSLNIHELSTLLKNAKGHVDKSGNRLVRLSTDEELDIYPILDRYFSLGESCILNNYSKGDRLEGTELKSTLLRLASDTSVNLNNPKAHSFIVRAGFLSKSPTCVWRDKQVSYNFKLNQFDYFEGYTEKGWFSSPVKTTDHNIQGAIKTIYYYPIRPTLKKLVSNEYTYDVASTFFCTVLEKKSHAN